MTDIEDDIAAIAAQERALVFARFDEDVAYDLGREMRALATARGLAVVIDIRAWDRPLFFAALPGTSADNSEWVRRKANVVRRFRQSSYRFRLDFLAKGRSLLDRGLSEADYVLAGGGFPVVLQGAGPVGAVTVSGLPERDDHALVVEALCAHLGADHAALRLASA